MWVAPYTGSLALIEGVIGAGFRFASVIGASAGDSEGDNEGDSATPAGWNYVLVDPTNPANAGGFFTGHESVDFLSAKTIVFWANNVAETSLPDWRIMCDARDQNGTRLISVDPRFTVTCAQSDEFVPIRPGADTALIDGIINQIFLNGTYDTEYIRANTVGPYLIDPRDGKWLRAKEVIAGAKDDYVVFDESDNKIKAASDPTLKTPAILGTHPREACRRGPPYRHCGHGRQIHPGVHRKGDRRACSASGFPRPGLGGEQAPRGEGRLRAVALVPRRLAHAGASDPAGDHGQHRRPWWRGDHLCRRDGGDHRAIRPRPFLGAGGHQDYTLLEPMDFCSAVEKGEPFPVKAAWFPIDNFAQQMSDRNRIRAAMEQLEFIVVSDYSLTATADLADVILPACTYFEKTDLLSSNNFYLQYMPKIIDPLFESKSDLDAIRMIADKMGVGSTSPKPPRSS